MLKLKKTSFSIPEDLHRRFKSACTDRSVTMFEALIAAITSWIEGTTYTPPPAVEYSAAEQRRIALLVFVMRHGNPDHIDAVTDAIEQIARSVPA
jgi:hypothetical protein